MDAVNHYSSNGVGFAVSDDGYAFRRIGSENEFINIRDMRYSSSEPSWCDIRSATVIVGDEQAEWLLHHLNERASVSDHPYRLELVVVRNTHSVIQTL